MRRVLRNYLISFVVIGLFFLAVHLINRYVEQRPAGAGQPAGTESPRQPGSAR